MATHVNYRNNNYHTWNQVLKRLWSSCRRSDTHGSTRVSNVATFKKNHQNMHLV